MTRERHALRVVLDGLLLGPARGGDARPQVLEVRLGDLDRERADRGVARWPFGHDSHVVLLGGDGGVVTARSLLASSARRPRRDAPGLHGGCSRGCPRAPSRRTAGG